MSSSGGRSMWTPGRGMAENGGLHMRLNTDYIKIVSGHRSCSVNAVVKLEWQFSPPDYFEVLVSISRDDYTMTIADGKVEATIDSATYDATPSMRQVLHDELNARFLGVQLLSHRAYELSKSTMTRVHPDGRRDTIVFGEPGHIKISGHGGDIKATDIHGKVIDTKRDRIETKKRLAELVSTYSSSDTLLPSLLRSYDEAVRDPDNELVHLYEIRDALADNFGGRSAARSALSITSSQWSRLGQLCNDEPLRQGRHGGKSGGALRDATEGELTEARAISRAMIEAYLQHLQASTRAGGPC